MDEEKKREIQVNKLFNTSERAVKLWIARFLNKNPDDLFDMVPATNEPVFFDIQPAEPAEPAETKVEKKYLELRLEVVEHDYNLDLGNLVKENIIADTIHFFAYSVRSVYASVVNTIVHQGSPGELDSKTNARDVLLEWDGSTMTFSAEYSPDLVKQYRYLNYVYGCMRNAKNGLRPEQEEKWQKDFKELQADMSENLRQMKEKNMDDQIAAKKKEWKKMPRIGVVARWITGDRQEPH